MGHDENELKKPEYIKHGQIFNYLVIPILKC